MPVATQPNSRRALVEAASSLGLRFCWTGYLWAIAFLPLLLSTGTAQAQTGADLDPPNLTPPLPDSLPLPNDPGLPAPSDLLHPDSEPLLPTNPVNPIPVETPPQTDQEVYVREIQVVGVTVFDPEEIAAITRPYSNQPITFAQLLDVRTEIIDLYLNAGYLTSSAFVPPQTLQDDVVIIEVIEGTLAEVEVNGTDRLNPTYISARLEGSPEDPLDVDRLLDRLRLLRLDPRVESLSAELSAGTDLGSSILTVDVVEANTMALDVFFDNASTPAVGEFRRGVVLREDNLFGQGDEYLLAFSNTEGSNLIETGYSYPR